MRNSVTVVGLAGALAVASACGDTKQPPAAEDAGGKTGSGGFKPAAGKSGKSDGEGGAGGAPVVADPLAPVVTITAPAGVDSPNDGVIHGTEVEVVCTAQPSPESGAKKVDRASIKLQLLDAEGMLVEEKPGTPTTSVDEYANTFIVADYPAGVIGFRCTARDEGGEHVGEHQIGSFFDRGPKITFIAPEPESAQALAEILAIDFKVEPAMLSDDDEGAVVESVSLEAGGVTIDLAEYEEEPGAYFVELNLRDASLFTPVPNGSFPLTVRATNSRTPNPVTAVVTQPSAVDGAGPVVKIISPATQQGNVVVGGKVPLTFEVSDEVSGVEPESIVVTLNDVQHRYSATDPDWGRPSANRFVFEFDTLNTAVTGNAKVQITVGIDAKDKVGNAADVKASALLYLDNYPPSVDLDPFNIRGVNKDGECTVSFDPVGDAVNDEASVQTAGIFRAVVWDNTNEVEGVPVKYHSGTNPARVRLYLRPGDGLLVEKNDGDPYCDDVVDVDSTDSVALDPVPSQGSPWWNDSDLADGEAPTPESLECETRAFDDAEHISCENNVKSDMWQVIKHGDGRNVVYGVQVASGTCTGSGWEFGPKIPEDGWVCFAVRAVDFTENVGVSRPLRVCVDDLDRPGTPACKTGAPPPSCTDGCIPAPRWGNVGVRFD